MPDERSDHSDPNLRQRLTWPQRLRLVIYHPLLLDPPRTWLYLVVYIVLAWIIRFAIGALWQHKSVLDNVAATTGFTILICIAIALGHTPKWRG